MEVWNEIAIILYMEYYGVKKVPVFLIPMVRVSQVSIYDSLRLENGLNVYFRVSLNGEI